MFTSLQTHRRKGVPSGEGYYFEDPLMSLIDNVDYPSDEENFGKEDDLDSFCWEEMGVTVLDEGLFIIDSFGCLTSADEDTEEEVGEALDHPSLLDLRSPVGIKDQDDHEVPLDYMITGRNSDTLVRVANPYLPRPPAPMVWKGVKYRKSIVMSCTYCYRLLFLRRYGVDLGLPAPSMKIEKGPFPPTGGGRTYYRKLEPRYKVPKCASFYLLLEERKKNRKRPLEGT